MEGVGVMVMEGWVGALDVEKRENILLFNFSFFFNISSR